MRREWRKDHLYIGDSISNYAKWLEEQLHTVRLAMSQVDDELVVNWIAPPTDGNYRKALSQLVTQGIEEADFFAEQRRKEIEQDEQAKLDELRYGNHFLD